MIILQILIFPLKLVGTLLMIWGLYNIPWKGDLVGHIVWEKLEPIVTVEQIQETIHKIIPSVEKAGRHLWSQR